MPPDDHTRQTTVCKVTKFVRQVRTLAPDAAIAKGGGQMHILTRRKADSSGYHTNFHSGDLQEKGRGPDRR